MMIHGSNLRNWEAECIAPLLAVFCYLLANLLFSLHDIDFHSQDSGESDSGMKIVFLGILLLMYSAH